MRSKRLFSRTLFILTILLVMVQCSDSPSSTDESNTEDPAPVENAACENLRFESDSAKPTHYITIEGFTEEFGENAYGWMRDINNPDKKAPIVFLPDFSEQTADFVIPVHPVNPMDGGEVEIEIVQQDENFTCTGFNFALEALTPSPGASEELVDSYKNGLNDIIAAFGYNPDEIKNKTVDEVDDVNPALIPLVLAYHSFESNIFENNLTAILEGTAPILEGQPLTSEQKQLLDAVIAESNIANQFEDFASSLSSNLKSSPGTSKQNNKYKRLRYNNESENNEYEPAELSFMMGVQRSSEKLTTGGYGAAIQTVTFISGVYALIAGLTTVGTKGISSPVSVPPGLIAGGISTSTAIAFFVSKGLAAILPSELESLKTAATQTEFNEDYADIAGWETKLILRGEKFSLTATDIISFLPLGKAFNIKPIKNVVKEVEVVLLETFKEIGTTVASEYDNSGVLEIKIKKYETILNPERENEDQYFIWEIDYLSSWDGTPPVFAMCSECTDDTNLGFYPLKEGVAELRAEAKAEPFYFPTNPTKTQKIVVKPIEITIAPQSSSLTPDEVQAGATINYQADVSYANNQQLEWTADDGFFSYNDDLAHNVTYYPPETLGSYTVTAEAVTEAGPREGRNPPRTENARVYIEEEEEGCAHFDAENAKTVKVEASGSYNNSSPASDFSISYAFADADPESETACGYSGVALEDDISLPWSFEKRMSPPFSASINITGLQDHANNMTLTIYVDGEVVEEYTLDGFLGSGDIEPDGSALVYAE